MVRSSDQVIKKDLQYCFPPQPVVIDACAELAKKIVDGESIIDQPNQSSLVPEIKPRDLSKLQPEKNVPEKVLVVVGYAQFTATSNFLIQTFS
jgi:DNA cross-link repair 1A protein